MSSNETSTQAVVKSTAIKGWASTPFMPLAIRMLPASGISNINITNNVGFKPKFIHGYLNPYKVPAYANGFFFVGKGSNLHSKSFYLMDADLEPFAPGSPGEHCAKISPIIRKTAMEDGTSPGPNNYTQVPLFVRAKDTLEYKYFGTYRKVVGNHKLGFDTTTEHVPGLTKHFWAAALTSAKRPAWTVAALKEALAVKSAYSGLLPGNPEDDMAITKALSYYMQDLKDCDEKALEKAQNMTPAEALEAMEFPDDGGRPVLEFSYEYLECIGYDHEFYDNLVKMQEQGDDFFDKIRQDILRERRANLKTITYKPKNAPKPAPVATLAPDSSMAQYMNSFLPGAKLPPKPANAGKPQSSSEVSAIPKESKAMRYNNNTEAQILSKAVVTEQKSNTKSTVHTAHKAPVDEQKSDVIVKVETMSKAPVAQQKSANGISSIQAAQPTTTKSVDVDSDEYPSTFKLTGKKAKAAAKSAARSATKSTTTPSSSRSGFKIESASTTSTAKQESMHLAQPSPSPPQASVQKIEAVVSVSPSPIDNDMTIEETITKIRKPKTAKVFGKKKPSSSPIAPKAATTPSPVAKRSSPTSSSPKAKVAVAPLQQATPPVTPAEKASAEAEPKSITSSIKSNAATFPVPHLETKQPFSTTKDGLR